MKVLVLCSAGSVRSVAMADILKQDYGMDALAAGHDLNSQKTIDMLSDWADVILVMQPHYAHGILKRNAHKIQITDVGPDVWGNSRDPFLRSKVQALASGLVDQGILRP